MVLSVGHSVSVVIYFREFITLVFGAHDRVTELEGEPIQYDVQNVTIVSTHSSDRHPTKKLSAYYVLAIY